MLAGDLTEFTLPDLFQLLGLTKKSGVLRISRDGVEGRVYFRDGEVCFAVSDDRRLPLGARLVGSGHLGADRLQSLLREHRGGSGVDVAAGLLASGEIEESTLGGFLREQVHDALFALLRLDSGEFRFDAGEALEWAGPRYQGAEVLEEAHRRIDEWSRLSAHMPDPGAVLSMVPNPSGGASLTLDREQWQLVALVDGQRTVAEVIDLGGKGEFATGKLLGELVESGLLEAHERPGQGDLADLLAGRQALRRLEEVALGAVSTAPSPAGMPAFDDGSLVGSAAGADPVVTGLGGRRPSWEHVEIPDVTGSPSVTTVEAAVPEPVPGDAAGDAPGGDDAWGEPAGESAGEPAEGAAPLERAEDGSDERDGTHDPVPGDDAEPVATVASNPSGDTEPAEPAEDTEDTEPSEVVEDAEPADDDHREAAVDHGDGDREHDAGGGGTSPAAARTLDRAQVARELASLGLDEEPPTARPRAVARKADGSANVNAANGHGIPADGHGIPVNGNGAALPDAASADGLSQARLARDDDVTRGLLLRLIDGVKGA
jgi:hypothetical protein